MLISVTPVAVRMGNISLSKLYKRILQSFMRFFPHCKQTSVSIGWKGQGKCATILFRHEDDD